MSIKILDNFILESDKLNYDLMTTFTNILMNIFNSFNYNADFYIYINFIILTHIRVI